MLSHDLKLNITKRIKHVLEHQSFKI